LNLRFNCFSINPNAKATNGEKKIRDAPENSQVNDKRFFLPQKQPLAGVYCVLAIAQKTGSEKNANFLAKKQKIIGYL